MLCRSSCNLLLASFAAAWTLAEVVPMTYAIATELETDGDSRPSVFSDRPLLPVWLGMISGVVDVDVERLVLNGDEFRELRLPISVADQNITISGGEARFAGGTLTIDIAQHGKQTAIAVSGKNIDAEQVSALKNAAISAPIDFSLDVVGTGWSPREIAASAYGTVSVEIGSGTIADGNLRRVGQDLLSMMMMGLNPFRPPTWVVPRSVLISTTETLLQRVCSGYKRGRLGSCAAVV